MHAQAPALHTLFQDAHFLAVDKPAGTIVHSDGTGIRTLTDLVRNDLLASGNERAAMNLQALNRLDRDTTGIVLFSLNKTTQPLFDEIIAAHDTNKIYRAICIGDFPWSRRTIDSPLARDRHDAKRMRIDGNGTPSLTHVEKLESRAKTGTVPALSMLEIKLGTGRKHQIRVHLASLGYPILGDELYGRPCKRANGKKYPLMLHAFSVDFIHPISNEPLHIEAPVPKRMTALFPQNKK